jgi:triacylglycerol lipase
MMKKRILSCVAIFTAMGSIAACSTADVRRNPEMCASKYPVILVHGIAFRDKVGIIRYWGKTGDYLKAYGTKVYLGDGDAYGTIAGNAGILKKQIEAICSETGAAKVNIIAHSRGGLEARYLISTLGMADKVASLTTIATPHRGSPMADFLMKKIKPDMILDDLINISAKLLGDGSPSSYVAGNELTTEYMAGFNSENPDLPGVYYQSYAAEIGPDYPNPIWNIMASVIAKKEGANDGLVSVTSAKWGDYRGVATCDGRKLVSHSDIIGMHLVSGEFCFNELDFYRDIVCELKIRGF